MVGFYDITGFHTTGRQRLSQGLMAGHLRSQRTSVFPSKTVINNNIFTGGYADYGCYDSHSCDSTHKWMNWLMGGGMIASVLGGIFGANKTEGAGGGSDKPAAPASDNSNLKEDIKALQTQFPDAKLSALSNNTILCNGTKCKDIDEALKILNKTPDNKNTKIHNDDNNGNGPKLNTQENQVKALAKLFNDAGMAGLKTQEEVDAKFEELAGTKPYKIDTSGDGITINAVDDLGNKTSKADSIKITPEQLKDLKSGEYTSLGTFAGKEISAVNLDGYLRIKVGDQTYIVGEDGKGYQMKDGNVDGYDETNWKYAPSPKSQVSNTKAKKTNSQQQKVSDKNKQNQNDVYSQRAGNGYEARYNKQTKKWTYYNPNGKKNNCSRVR